MTPNPSAGRGVVITGASSGIGRAIAFALAEAGYQVFAGVRTYGDGDAVRAAANGDLTPVIIEVTDPESIAAAAGEIDRMVGSTGLAGLINNAGTEVNGPIEVIPVADLRRLYEVNVFGQVAVTQAFLPLLRTGAGRILNVGSVVDRMSLPFWAPVGSSKWALAAITDALRLELHPWGIQVVLIEPAAINTRAFDMVEVDVEQLIHRMRPTDRARYADAYRTAITRLVEMGRTGSDPDVVARVVVRALTARRPRTRYLAGKGSRLLAALAWSTPDRLLDRIRLRIFGPR